MCRIALSSGVSFLVPRAHASPAATCREKRTRDEPQVLAVSVAKQHEVTGQVISLTKQRREVLGHPERLERLSITPGLPHVELIASPTNRASHQNIVQISTSDEELYGSQLRDSTGPRLLSNAASPGRRETALTS